MKTCSTLIAFNKRLRTGFFSKTCLPSRPLSTVVQRAEASMDSYWMPFTDNIEFKKNPSKMFERAEGMNYYLEDGTQIVDGMSGLWCVNAGHAQPKIVKAVQDQVAKLDFAPSFYTSSRLPFQFADKILGLLPEGAYSQVFFTMCGSTAVDTALKMALHYHKANGNAGKVRFIGRERGYHGVGFGGISVGGIMPNRKAFAGNLLPFVDHIPHTHSLPHMAFSKGQPEWGAHLADELERTIALHDASTVAAVIVEPVAGSTGVLPPPVGYLERLREICTKHNVLLIFDEVITGFGRLGTSFATTKFGVEPDLITCAKGLTNATVPCGAVICKPHIFDTIQHSAHQTSGSQIELFHGFTYSGHPLAMAAGMATLEVLEEQQLFQNAANMAPYFEERLHSLRGLPNVIDIRNIGLMGAVELQPLAGAPATRRAMDVFHRCFDKGVLVRCTGSTMALSPPLISTKSDLDKIISTLALCIEQSNAELKA